MTHKYRLLEKKLIEGEISPQEFKNLIDKEFEKLEDELMTGEITPDQQVERYNELLQMESPPPFEGPKPHEHI